MKTTGAIAALLLLLLAVTRRDTAVATSFTPSAYSVTVANSASSVSSNISTSYVLDSPHSLFESHISFVPSAFGVSNGSSVVDGAVVGTLSIAGNESQSNGACQNQPFLSYTLLDASTDTAAANTLADTPRIPDPLWPGFADSNTNGLPDAVDKYPNFLKTLYPGLTPRSRAYGSIASDIGTINRVVNVLVFDPGTTLPGHGAIDAALGYIAVVVPQDPTAPAAPSVINEACTSFQYTRLDRGTTANNPNTATNEGGITYRTNPSADGSYTFIEYLRSRRDQDDDGIENHLDSCPYVSTPSWNPRASDPVSDPDSDGIPGKDDPAQTGEQLQAGTGCDPTPLTAGSDPDADGFVNRQDNCPLAANAGQEDPDGDGIGSACDVVPTFGDGHLHEVCVSTAVTVGTGGTPATPACPKFITEMDGDGYLDTVEAHVGTAPGDNCGNHTTTAPIYSQAWPADLYSGEGTPTTVDKVTLQDVLSYVAPVKILGTNPGDGNFRIRWDLVPGKGPFSTDINIQDLLSVVVVTPPMLGGVRAFGGPSCPYPS